MIWWIVAGALVGIVALLAVARWIDRRAPVSPASVPLPRLEIVPPPPGLEEDWEPTLVSTYTPEAWDDETTVESPAEILSRVGGGRTWE